MGLMEYCYMISGIVLLSIFGRSVTKNGFVSSFLAGLLIISAIISITSRYIPVYNVLIIKVLLAVGCLIFIYEMVKKAQLKGGCFDKVLISKKDMLVIFLIMLFVGVYFIRFHYQLFLFESHSVLYFGPSFEMLKADYIGNLRVPTHYPSHFSAMHMLASAAAAVVGFLNPYPNLAYFTEIRYVLIIIFLTNFIYVLYKMFKPHLGKLLLICLLVFCIYGEEIHYTLYVSSFMYVFVLLEIFLRSLSLEGGNWEKKRSNVQDKGIKEFLFFAIILVVCKAPIFYIAGIFAIYLWWKSEKYRFSPLIIVGGLLVIANIYTWWDVSRISTSVIKASSQFTLSGNFDFSEVFHWSLEDAIRHLVVLVDRGERVGGTLMLCYMIVKYYGVFGFITLRNKGFHKLKVMDKALIVYTIVSLIGILFVRNNGRIEHQAHAYFLMSILSCCALIVLLLKSQWNKNLIVGMTFIFIVFALPSKFIGLLLPNESVFSSADYGHLRYKDANLQSRVQQYYRVEGDESYWKSEINSQLSGLRMRGSDFNYINHGQTRKWIIGAEKKMVW